MYDRMESGFGSLDGFLRGGDFREQTYTPIFFTVGTETHKLALCRLVRGDEWVVSDPRSGAKILTVRGDIKGVPCSSRTFPERLALELAMAELDALVNRIGSERFNAVLRNPKPF